jgi:putative tryptophan/tyrosine transport system substrate-binding protein
MLRRDFITLIGGAAAAWPLAARAQQPAMPVIGFLSSTTSGNSASFVAAFRQGLKDTGFVEGQNVAIAYRFAEGRNEQLPALAADLIRRNVAVIAASGGTPSALAAKAATSTIPIVFVTGEDPVRLGLVQSFNRPGGNVTGVALFANTLWPKCLELLSEITQKTAVVGALVHPGGQDGERERQAMQMAADQLGRVLVVVTAGAEGDIEPAFAVIAEKHVGALIVSPDALFTNRRDQIAALAARHGVPTIYQWREYIAAGGLMSYGTSLPDSFRQEGTYVGRILRGEKPADLPVQQPTKFELVINLKTAKALGLTVPNSLLVAADEVIE